MFPVDVSMITASPCDLNDLPEYSNDLRTLDKVSERYTLYIRIEMGFLNPFSSSVRLFDGMNITTDDKHMWLIPFTSGF